MTPTYKEQFDKITRAYINGELKPWDACACFIGNIFNNTEDWIYALPRNKGFHGSDKISRGVRQIREQSNYTPEEIEMLEYNFLNIYSDVFNNRKRCRTEETLYNAMVSTLEMLRQIHISKGENVEMISLIKRTELVNNKTEKKYAI